MFRKGYQAEAARLAKDLNVKIVGPLDGLRTADMLGAHVARDRRRLAVPRLVDPCPCLVELAAELPVQAGRV